MIERLRLTGCVCRQDGDKDSKCMLFFFTYVSLFSACVMQKATKWGRKTCPGVRARHLMKQWYVLFFSLSLFPPCLLSAKIIPLLVKWKVVAEGCFCAILIHYRKWISAFPRAMSLWAKLLIYGPVLDQNGAVRHFWQMLLSDGEIITPSSRAGWLVRHFV